MIIPADRPGRGPRGRPPPDWWAMHADRLGLRLIGAEAVGPCPLCGGTDRFAAVLAGGKAGLVHCRGCGDARDFLPRVLEAAGWQAPESSLPRSRTPARAAPRSAEPATADGTPAAPMAAPNPARAVWAAGIPADGTPAHTWLARRCAWPPSGTPLPPSVQWLPAAAGLGAGVALPRCAQGALVWALTRPGSAAVLAVQLEALTEWGDTVQDTRRARFRRTHGPARGAAFAAAQPATDNAPRHLAEGPCDALALAWRHPGAAVWAACGAANLPAAAARLPGTGPLTLHADGDAAGREAVREARTLLAAVGVDADWAAYPPGMDAAAELEAEIGERAAVLEDGGCDPGAALAAAWAAWTEWRTREGA